MAIATQLLAVSDRDLNRIAWDATTFTKHEASRRAESPTRAGPPHALIACAAKATILSLASLNSFQVLSRGGRWLKSGGVSPSGS